MSRQEAQQQALANARDALAGIDLPARFPALGLPGATAGELRFRLFGQDACLDLDRLDLRWRADARPVPPSDHILVLRYLRYDGTAAVADDWVSFRDFPGGGFYLGPFLARTVQPLVRGLGNDLAGLRQRLQRFDTTPLPWGDLGVRIHALGHLAVALVYHLGDEEFGPAADLLFSATVRRAFTAEEAAVLAGRICLGLLPSAG